jgi:hypothetical protein
MPQSASVAPAQHRAGIAVLKMLAKAAFTVPMSIMTNGAVPPGELSLVSGYAGVR